MARKLATARATDEKDIGPGTRTDLEPHDHVMRLEQGNSSSYLLRRLARDHPVILARYERAWRKTSPPIRT